MKKRIFAVLLVCAALIAELSACNKKDKGEVFVIATDTTFAPIEFQDAQGNYVGVDIELLAAIAKDQGFKYDLKPLGDTGDAAAGTDLDYSGTISGNTADGQGGGVFVTFENGAFILDTPAIPWDVPGGSVTGNNDSNLLPNVYRDLTTNVVNGSAFGGNPPTITGALW